jgi:hypothetical protein
MKFTIGADPEIFVQDAHSLRSIIGKVGGTKLAPLPLALGDGYAVQEDNVAMEFNIPPAGTKEQFIHSISSTVNFLSAMVRDMHGFTVCNLSAASFPDRELANEQAWIFGCDPDFNAWTGGMNPRPHSEDKNLRSCGGHVHIGIENATKDMTVRAIKACDLYMGVPSVLMDMGEKRKQLYGKAGAFRFKPFGVEYRTLSNFWVFNNNLIDWVYDNTSRALDAVQNGFDFDAVAGAIQHAINLNDKELAMQLVNDYQLDVR